MTRVDVVEEWVVALSPADSEVFSTVATDEDSLASKVPNEPFSVRLNNLRKDAANIAAEAAKDLEASRDVADARIVAQLKLTVGASLALSLSRSDNSKGEKLLSIIIEEAQTGSQVTDALFWSAVAKFHLGEYREARLLTERVLARDAERAAARNLHGLIRTTVRKDGMTGLGALVLVAVCAAVVGTVFGKLRR